MKTFFTTIAVLAMTACSIVHAKEAESEAKVESGLQPGKQIGAFYVTKCAGAEEDGVEVGKNLCYRCKNGGRPQIMVFTRNWDQSVAVLVKELDSAVAKHEKQELRAFVNLLGKDKNDLKEAAKKFGETTKAKTIPFVVPNEFKNGPEDYGLNPKAELTVIIAKGGKVVANHAYAEGKLDKKAVANILKDVKEKAVKADEPVSS